MTNAQRYSTSLRHLRKDKKFEALIRKYGPPQLERGSKPFQALCRSIVYQQLSGKAAATIFARFISLFGDKKFPTPKQMCAMPIANMRKAGLSFQKASYLHDLAEKFESGTIRHHSLHKMKSDEIIRHLTQVKGIGLWTVQMFLIFTLNRFDVLPTGDLGVRKGFQILYKLKDLPTHAEMEHAAKPWRQHASIVSWYLWRVADAAKAEKK